MDNTIEDTIRELGNIFTVPTSAGARASTIGRANDDTTMPIVMNMANSKHGLLLLPESSVNFRAIRVGMGART